MISRSALLLLLLVACSGDGSGTTSIAELDPVRTDSAGVTLLTHGPEALARAPHVTIDSTPVAVIQGSAEDIEADISTILPVLFLADGRLVGRDQQRQVLVVFGADGASRQEFGRQGAGPGEYGMIGGIVYGEGGTLLVRDYRNGRLSVFDPATGPGAEYSLSEAIGAGGSTPIGIVGDQVMLYNLNFRTDESGAMTASPGIKAVLFDRSSGKARRTFTTGPAEPEETPRAVSVGGGTMLAVRAISIPMFQTFPSVFAWDGRFVLSDGNAGRWEWRDTSGTLLQQLRVAYPRTAVTDKIVNDHISAQIAQITGAAPSGSGMAMMVMGGGQVDTAEVRRSMLSQPHGDSLPVFDRTQLTASGTLWVLDYPVPGRSGWAATAFDANGRILGRIVEARGEAPLVFGDDRAAFRTEDDLGIATITVRRLVFPD